MPLSSPRLGAIPLTCDALTQHLNWYALASCAAGVSFLALASPAEGGIVYTPAHVVIGNNGTYNLDLNHDGITDFVIREAVNDTSSGRSNALFVARVPAGNGLVGVLELSGENLASALTRETMIGSHKNFIGSYGGLMAAYGTLAGSGGAGGYWVDVTNMFLGFKFMIDGQTHYGWARLNVHVHSFSIHALLTGYAYETVAGQSIRAGQIAGTEDNPEFIAVSKGSEDSASSGAGSARLSLRRKSLGQLALGAQGLTLWRREDGAS